MNQGFEEKLLSLTKELKPGEMREVILNKTALGMNHGQYVVAHLAFKASPLEQQNENKIIQFPFTAHREGNEEVVIKGVVDQENIKKIKRSGKKFSLIRDFVGRKIQKWKDSYRRLGEREDDLDQIYQDEQGRDYELIDGIPTYLDDRGFDYYLKYDRDGNEYAWVKLDDGSIGTFLDSERTIIQIGDKAYRFDGTVRLDEELDIFPRR